VNDRLHRLLDNPEAVSEIALKDVPKLIGKLGTQAAAIETVKAALLLRMAEEANRQEPDRLLTAEEAAGILKVEKDWLYRQARNGNLPFVVRISSGQTRFSGHGLQRYIRQRTGQ
jgi:predicted DNA-binding transcriptional regulator AlpA